MELLRLAVIFASVHFGLTALGNRKRAFWPDFWLCTLVCLGSIELADIVTAMIKFSR